MKDLASIEESRISQNETSPLVRRNRSHLKTGCCHRVSCKKNICITSKAALIILMWSLVVCIQYDLILDPAVFLSNMPPISSIYTLALRGFVLLFYPLAGFFGDLKCGRYKLIKNGLNLIIPVATVEILLLIADTVIVNHGYTKILMYVLAVILACLMYTGVVLFNANVIQYGLDQLHDSPAQDSSLFIHWYCLLYYISLFMVHLARIMYFNSQTMIAGSSLFLFLTVISLLVLAITLFVTSKRTKWFLIESGIKVNPYKSVYRITKFSLQHKVPVRRSAFTYCEDELPSRLDLGKEKFGGPFTTEQVEDVKVFYGILKVLLSLGPVFFLEIPSSFLLQGFTQDWSVMNQGLAYTLLDNLSLSLLISIFLLLYLCIFRRFIGHLIPGMLKRMGIGFFTALLSLICTFAVYGVQDFERRTEDDISCNTDIFRHYNSTSVPFPAQVQYSLTLRLILPAFSQIFVYVAMFEFICAQSPHHMKGLLIGLSFAIKGLFQSIAIVLIIPYYISWQFSFPSCEFAYYLTNLAFGFIAFLFYIYIARRYKYRVRDEPSRERQYAEEYYSNTQQEKNYDYSVTI